MNLATLTLILTMARAWEQAPPTPPPAAEAGIADNSFLMEEAYNQDFGVVQHINAFTRSGKGEWVYTFTQEWPLPAQRHQVSYTLPLMEGGGETGVGDVALNYRYQALDGSKGGLAVAPRLSLLVPTGSSARGLGAGGAGLQANLAASRTLGTLLVAHSNLGTTWVPRAKNASGERAAAWGWNAGQSVVWLARPNFNALVELVWTRSREVVGPGRTQASDSLLLSPGIRWAYNFASGLQIVPGVAVPIGLGPSRGDRSLLLYLSFEHPFRHARP
jgi:hypothetical protein